MLITSSDPPTPFSYYSMAAEAALALWFESTQHRAVTYPRAEGFTGELAGTPNSRHVKIQDLPMPAPCTFGSLPGAGPWQEL